MPKINDLISRRVFSASFLLGAASCIPAGWAKGESQISNMTAPGAVNNPYGLRTGPDDDLYICEIGNHRISKLGLKSGKLSVVVDKQKEPYDIRFDRKGTLYFVDMPAHQVLTLDPKTGATKVVAGTGTPGFGGDGGPATEAQFKQPHSIAFDPSGKLLVCDIGNHRIRMIDPKTGVISTFAGTGQQGDTKDGAARNGTPLNGPRAIDFDKNGRLYLVLREGNRVYFLDPKSDTWHHFAGTGEKGYTGDGGDAKLAKLNGPKAICCAPDMSVYIADTESHTIRRISSDGVITTVAGTGTRGDGPVGDPLKCMLSRPHGLYVDRSGAIFIGDSEAHVVRSVRTGAK
jgi:streptogramin lyase